MNGSAEQQSAVKSDALQSLIDAMEASVAVIAPGGTIVCVNQAWRRSSRQNGGDQDSFYVGQNYLQICEKSSGGVEVASLVGAGISRVLNGAEEFSTEYPCQGPTEHCWFVMVARPFDIDGVRYALVTHRAVTTKRPRVMKARPNDRA